MASRIRRWLPAAGIVAAAVLATATPVATAAPDPAVNAEAPFAVEDGAYPDAQQILQDTGATLTRGDSGITYTSCDSPHQIAVWGRSVKLPLYRICFAVPGATGYLALTVPDAFRIETSGRALRASLTTDGKTQNVDVPEDTAVGVGEGSSPTSKSVLLELRVTGATGATTGGATGPGAPIVAHGSLPGGTIFDAFTATVRIDIGDKRTCSGTLVDPSWILTAASCFTDHPEQGINVPAGAPADKTTVAFARRGLTVPPAPNNIAVVELVPRADRDLVMARLASPVTDIEPMHIATVAPAQGDPLVAAGYGRTGAEWTPDTLHALNFTVGAVASTGIDLAEQMSDGTLCKGDAGSPATRPIDERHRELVAVNSRSWQHGCLGSDETIHSGAYDTRVDDLGPWFQQLGVYAGAGSGYTPITATRVMDTRAAGGTRTWPAVTGQNGGQKILDLGPDSTSPAKLPAGATAAVLNITVVNPTNGGWLTAEANDKARPTWTSLNFIPGQLISNLVTVPVAPDGKVHLFTNTTDFDALVDVVGFYSPTSTSKYSPHNPVRILDTRTTGGPITAGAVRDLQVTGQNDVPADATAVVVTLTTVGSTNGGYITAFPAGTTRPAVSNINFTTGAILSNQAIVPIGTGGKISLYNFSGTSNLVVELAGYYSPTATKAFHPLSPVRLKDTRLNNGSPLAMDETIAIDVPYSADAVVVNATTVGSDGASYFTLFPHGITRPATSDLNFTANALLSGHATVATGSGQIDLYNRFNHSHAIVDLSGYFN
ncbi:trypsin-like serine protease [Streptomyces sp. SPB162]|uniref:trypsin-like serine protease n=1 Tax=Streptomyces sp. SPB162 TaxID=2940560 RepID=UPI002405903D|nr:trypsin-like serine protease [Streptomyces sp. SPB162]MDF9816424.1 hypothetical protein [Streptomyces sp. SPB162]